MFLKKKIVVVVGICSSDVLGFLWSIYVYLFNDDVNVNELLNYVELIKNFTDF